MPCVLSEPRVIETWSAASRARQREDRFVVGSAAFSADEDTDAR
jgi:hypothetical protein